MWSNPARREVWGDAPAGPTPIASMEKITMRSAMRIVLKL